ncbi:hypothetical protein MXB_4018, partial [Myxobolus squamalis]
NGEYIIGCSISDRPESRFTNIWKYNPLLRKKYIKPNINCSKISSDNCNIFGIDCDFSTRMIDMETAQLVRNIRNENMTRLPWVNYASLNDDNNLLLSLKTYKEDLLIASQ